MVLSFSFADAGATLPDPAPPPPFHEWRLLADQVFASFHRYHGSFLVRFPGLADFTVSADGQAVTGFHGPDLKRGTLDHLLLNQIRPLALSLQGKNMFHASAVELAGQAVAFAGRSGQGKSTLAASFARHGHGFLTDDGLELSDTPEGHQAHPSHSSLRLWPDSLGQLLPADAELADPIQHSTKSRVLADARLPHVDKPLPLKAIYVLEREDVAEVSITEMKPAEALIGLVNHSFLLNIDDRAATARHFERVTDLARSLPIFRLDYPRRYDRLADVREAVIRHTLQYTGPDAARHPA